MEITKRSLRGAVFPAIAAILGVICVVLTLAVVGVGYFILTSDSGVKCDSPRPLPRSFSSVDPCNMEQVLTTAISTIYSWNPAQESSPIDAIDRARPLLSDELWRLVHEPSVDPFLIPQLPDLPTTDQWAAWAASEKRVAARCGSVTRQPHPTVTVYRSVVSKEGIEIPLRSFVITFTGTVYTPNGYWLGGITVV